MKRKSSIRKRFIAVESDSLVIETIQTGESKRLRIIRLKGIWRANKQNELCFDAVMRKGPPETYTFKGSWGLNKNQQIEYVCGDGTDVLTFKGYWDLTYANRLVYLFEGSSTSRFEFKAEVASPSFYPKEGEIRYRIGIGARKNRLTARTPVFTLYGQWKLGRKLGLTFQMDYGRGKIREIDFGAEVSFVHSKVNFALKDRAGDALGINITMTRKFLDSLDAEAFIRLKTYQDQYGVEAGVSVPF